MSKGLRKLLLKNTASNYLKMILKLIITIFLTRLLFINLSRDDYGFWALLWSVFGYSLLLDFGFGAAIQKITSENKVKPDWTKYNKTVSSVFFNYLFLSILIIITTLIIAYFLENLFHFEEGVDISYYKRVFIIFGVGSAAVFPIGFFAEILRGLFAISARNKIQSSFRIVHFVLMYAAIKNGFSLLTLTIITIGTEIIINLLLVRKSFLLQPEMKISIKFYDYQLQKKVLGFSFFAYIITFTNLIIFRTDQIVISIFASVSLVAIYQISSRLADTFRRFSSQFLENLSPVAATLLQTKETGKLGKILIQSNRLLGFITTLFFVPLLVYVKDILRIWLNLTDNNGAICAMILLTSMYILVFLRSSSVYILLMGNKQKQLALVAVLECFANLIISVLLIKRIGIAGVALGTLIPNVIFALIYNIPAGLKFAEVSIKNYFSEAILRTVFIGLIYSIFVIFLSKIFEVTSIINLFISLILSGFVYLLLYYFLGTHKWERKQLFEFVRTKLKK